MGALGSASVGDATKSDQPEVSQPGGFDKVPHMQEKNEYISETASNYVKSIQ